MSEVTPSSPDVTKTPSVELSTEQKGRFSFLPDILLRKLVAGIIFVVLSSLLLVWAQGMVGGGYLGDSLNDTLLTLSFVFFGYLLPLSVLSDLLLRWLSRFSLISKIRLVLSLLLYLLIILSFWALHYEGEKLTFTVPTLVALVCWGLEGWIERYEKVRQWFLRIPAWIKQIALIPTILLTVVFGFFTIMFLLLTLFIGDRQTLVEEIPSPDGAYTIQVYELGESDYSMAVDVVFNHELRDPRRFYFQIYDEPIEVKWSNQQVVEINGHKLNVLKDTYTETPEEAKARAEKLAEAPKKPYSGETLHWKIRIDPNQDFNNTTLQYKGTDFKSTSHIHVVGERFSVDGIFGSDGTILYYTDLEYAGQTIHVKIKWDGRTEEVDLKPEK